MEIEKKLKRNKKAAVRRRPGRLTSSPVVPGKPNFLYVDFLDGSPPVACWNPSLPPAPGIHVLVEERNGRRTILSDRAVFADDYSFSFTKFHRDNHLWHGPDPVMVDLRQILWLQPTANGLVLSVRSGWLLTTGWIYFAGDSVDLTDNRPASGARFVLVTIASDGALTATNGDIVDDIFALVKEDIPALPSGHRLICAVRLYAGQITIRNTQFNADLFDLRFAEAGKVDLSGYQPLSDPLTQISGLTFADGDIIQQVGGELTNRTMEELTQDLSSGLESAPVMQGVIQRLAAGITDVTIVVVGDSTGNGTDEWFYLAMVDLQALYPAYTLKYATWSDATKSYSALSTVEDGSGSFNINAYNGSTDGKSFVYSCGNNIAKQVGEILPHLIFINYGHNEGSTGSEAAYELTKSVALSLTEPLRVVAPEATLVIMSQNPRYDAGVTANISGHRALRFRQIAEMRGYGFVDICKVFLDTGSPEDYILAGGVHPNSDGNRLWTDAIVTLFLTRVNAQPRQAQPSSLATPSINLLKNGDFASFASPPTLTNWTPDNCTLSKETTLFESQNLYSVRLQATAPGSQSQIYQDINKNLVLGQYITAAARIRVPAGQAGSVGRIAISYTGGGVTQRGYLIYDEWFWVVVSARIPITSSFVRIRLYADSGTAGGADMYADRIVCARGLLPRDCF